MGDRHIPIIDEDKLDDIITALQALSAPSGTDVAISPTGMHIVTEDDVQGAISELDSAVDSVNSNLTNLADTLKFDNESVLDLSNSTTFTAPKAGFLRGYFRKTADTTNIGVVGAQSNKNSNAFIYIQSIAKELSGGYCPIDLFVVKGETLNFTTLNNINLSSSRVAFTPLNNG